MRLVALASYSVAHYGEARRFRTLQGPRRREIAQRSQRRFFLHRATTNAYVQMDWNQAAYMGYPLADSPGRDAGRGETPRRADWPELDLLNAE